MSIHPLVCVTLLGSPALAQEPQPLAAGTPWQTDYFVVDSGRPGPTVMIVGGVHGDEPAGARAARHLLAWRPRRGKLIVVPVANRRAIATATRRTPDRPKGESDLNRQFPKQDGDQPHGDLAAALWQLVQRMRPDWLLDLHEGYDFARRNRKSVGSSVIASPAARAAAGPMIAAVDATITDPHKKFALKGPAATGSLARAVADRLGIPTMILETTSTAQHLPVRTRQHRVLVHRFLVDLGMLEAGDDVDRMVPALRRRQGVRVALFDASGVSSKASLAVEQDLSADRRFVVRRVGPALIRRGGLRQFDAVVFPGGTGAGTAKSLGDAGRRAVRTFVAGGGGYVGFCAGSYLAANNYPWSLRLVDADVIDRKHWRRGRGDVQIELTATGRQLLGDRPGRLSIRYVNGPIYAPGEDAGLPDYEVLAWFRSELVQNGAPRGVMMDTPAMVRSTFGKGRVFCSSPHPESTEGLEAMVQRAVRWASGQ